MCDQAPGEVETNVCGDVCVAYIGASFEPGFVVTSFLGVRLERWV